MINKQTIVQSIIMGLLCNASLQAAPYSNVYKKNKETKETIKDAVVVGSIIFFGGIISLFAVALKSSPKKRAEFFQQEQDARLDAILEDMRKERVLKEKEMEKEIVKRMTIDLELPGKNEKLLKQVQRFKELKEKALQK